MGHVQFFPLKSCQNNNFAKLFDKCQVQSNTYHPIVGLSELEWIDFSSRPLVVSGKVKIMRMSMRHGQNTLFW